MRRAQFPIAFTLFIALSFVITMTLTVWPLPFWLYWFKPPWLLLTLIYWVMLMPERINVGIAFLLGLLFDVFTGGLLGQHALAFVLVTYLMVDWERPMRLLPAWQQTLIVTALVSVYQFIIFVLLALTGATPWNWHYWLPTLLCIPAWLLLNMSFTACARRWQVT